MENQDHFERVSAPAKRVWQTPRVIVSEAFDTNAKTSNNISDHAPGMTIYQPTNS